MLDWYTTKNEQSFKDKIIQALNDNYRNHINDRLQKGVMQKLLTILSPHDEILYQVEKYNSPFSNDSGIDYDYRGFYKKYGALQPQATNGHLTDEFKLPNHPTFSVESKFYNGQPYAVDWNDDTRPYKYLGELGIL